MTIAILGILGVALCSTLIMVVRLTVTVSRTSSNALASLISFDQRAQQERDSHRAEVRGLVDRLLTGDVESIRVFESAEDTEPGGFYSPEEQEDDEEEPYARIEGAPWATASPMRERLDRIAEVDALANEDDLDGFTADRDRRLAQARERGVVE